MKIELNHIVDVNIINISGDNVDRRILLQCINLCWLHGAAIWSIYTAELLSENYELTNHITKSFITSYM